MFKYPYKIHFISKEAYIDICIQDIITIHNDIHANSDFISRSIGFFIF